MEISPQEVEKIALMSRLQLTESELSEYRADMKNILNLAAQLNEADTSDILPMAHPLEATQVLRPDLVFEIVDREKLQAIAPQVKSGYYLVPRVIEGAGSAEDDL